MNTVSKKQRVKGSAAAPAVGRPLKDENLLTVAIPDEGLKAVWDPEREQFVGDVEITRWASLYAATSHPFSMQNRGEPITCGTDSDEAILASMLAACGGRGVILSGALSPSK